MKLMNLFKSSPTYCPFCYAEVDLAKVEYRCGGTPAPGKEPCEKEDDEVYKRAFGFDSASIHIALPTTLPAKQPKNGEHVRCRICDGLAPHPVFPCCHSPVPNGFAKDSVLMGVIGARESGKSILLSVLDQEFDHTVGPRFNAAIANRTESMTLRTLRASRGEMDEGGRLPDQTRVSGHLAPLLYEWRYLGKSAATKDTMFSFYDTAGESLGSHENARDMRYLAATDRLIILLNPFAFEANKKKGIARGISPDVLQIDPADVLEALTTILQEQEAVKRGRKIRKPLAVVLSKIDAFAEEIDPLSPIMTPSSNLAYFDETESLAVHQELGSLIESWGGGALLRRLEGYYEDYRLFALSALGSEPDYEKSQASTRGVQPHRVAEPFLWHLAESKFIKKG